MVLLHFSLYQYNMETIQQQLLPLAVFYFHPNVDFGFLWQLFRWIYQHDISLTSDYFFFHWLKKSHFWSSQTPLNQSFIHGLGEMKMFYCRNIKFVMKEINNFLMNNKMFLHQNFPFLVLFLFCISHLWSYI